TAAAGVGPDVRRRLPGGPLHVAGVVPVRQRRVRRPELVVDLLLGADLHLAELLPGRRLVLAGAEQEHELVLVRHVVADVGAPRGERSGADVARAGVTCRAAGAALHAGLDAVLVALGRHLVRAVGRQVDAEPATG